MRIFCKHRKLCQPVVPGHRSGQRFIATGIPYVECCNCNRRFEFDAVTWRVGKEVVQSMSVRDKNPPVVL